MLRTKEQIQLFLNKTKQQKLKEKQRQKLKYKKAQEATKKILKGKSIKKAKQPPEKPLKYAYSLTIYQSHQVERETNEDNLYSLYELQHIEELFPEEEGRINWIVWNKLIDKYRKNL